MISIYRTQLSFLFFFQGGLVLLALLEHGISGSATATKCILQFAVYTIDEGRIRVTSALARDSRELLY